MKDSNSDTGSPELAFLKAGIPGGFSEQLREQKVIDLVPGVPVYELLEDACVSAGNFFLAHVRTGNKLGFRAALSEPIEVSEFLRTLDTYTERLRLFVDERSKDNVSGITSYQALNILESYSSWLKSFEPDGEISERHTEAFLRSVIQLRAELFEVAYNYEMRIIQSTIEAEVQKYFGEQNPLFLRETSNVPNTALIVRTKLRTEQLERGGQLHTIQQSVQDVLGELHTVIEEIRSFRDPGMGFHAALDGEEVRSDALCQVLFQAGQKLTDQFQNLDQRTGADLVLRLHLQNALTITDALLVHLMLNGHEEVIRTSVMLDISRYLQSAKYALQEIVDAANAYTD